MIGSTLLILRPGVKVNVIGKCEVPQDAKLHVAFYSNFHVKDFIIAEFFFKNISQFQILYKINHELKYARLDLEDALDHQHGDILAARKRVMWLEDRMGMLCGKVRLRVCVKFYSPIYCMNYNYYYAFLASRDKCPGS